MASRRVCRNLPSHPTPQGVPLGRQAYLYGSKSISIVGPKNTVEFNQPIVLTKPFICLNYLTQNNHWDVGSLGAISIGHSDGVFACVLPLTFWNEEFGIFFCAGALCLFKIKRSVDLWLFYNHESSFFSLSLFPLLNFFYQKY